MQNVKHAGYAASEKAQEVNQKAQYEVNKNIAQNPDNTIGNRAGAAFDALGNKVNEKTHEMKKEHHKDQAGITGATEGIKHAGNAATEKAKATEQKGEYELNKNIATNPDNTLGARAGAAFDAVGNKINEKTHEMKKDYHKDRAGLTSDKTL